MLDLKKEQMILFGFIQHHLKLGMDAGTYADLPNARKVNVM